MRFILVLLLVVHGLIHVLGFMKAWQLAALPQLSRVAALDAPPPVVKTVGLLWLVVSALLLASALSVLLRTASWWQLGLIGVAVSQLLILLAWQDAKAGTWINLLLLVTMSIGAAHERFHHESDAQATALLSDAASVTPTLLTSAAVASLPATVQRWLQRSGAVDRPSPRGVRLRQRGSLRASPRGAWMPVTASQYFNVSEPSFVWEVDARMAKVLPLVGRDSYLEGRGHMLIKLLSLVPVVDVANERIDQGTLLRFLGELCWFPGAAAHAYLQWVARDERSADVTMTHRGVTATATFTFDALGRVTSVAAERYLGGGPDAKREHWVIPMREWTRVGDVEIPVRGDAIWKLPDGDFSYYRWEIVELEADRFEPYASAR